MLAIPSSISEWLAVDQTSPSGLRWLKSRGCVSAGQTAGTRSKRDDYWRVWFNGESYLAHRVLRFLLGEDASIVDHKDGVRSNNNPGNLRSADFNMNSRNRKKPNNNTSGSAGVKLTVTHNGRYTNWTAQLRCNGVTHTKSFSHSVYGAEAAFAKAVAWRLEKIKELNETESAGITDRHGKD